MTEAAGNGLPLPRAFLRIGGASVARYQLGLALALDCQRVICLARSAAPELIELQHAAEDMGLQFHIVSSPRQLAGLVTAADELLVIADGLFADPPTVIGVAGLTGATVLVQPIEAGLEQGYERIDLNRAAAGLMRIPGSMVEGLHELPPDCDIPSALTRIALQSGIEMREVPAEARAGVRWRMVRSESEAHAVEDSWLRSLFGARAGSPGRALARFGVLVFGTSLLHAGNASAGLSIAVLAALGLAAGFAWFELAIVSFLLCAVAWVLLQASGLLRNAERTALGQLPPGIPRVQALSWLVDAVIALVSLSDVMRWPGEPWLSWIFTPAIFALLFHLVPRMVPSYVGGLISDRSVLSLLLALAAGMNLLLPTIETLSILLVVCGVIMSTTPRQD